MKRGKYLQMGSGSRSRSQAKAEDVARRSRKRAEKRAAMKTYLTGGTDMNSEVIRYAIVRGARTAVEAEAYLPDNYTVVHEYVARCGRCEGSGDMLAGTLSERACSQCNGTGEGKPEFVIEGRDDAGWTLEGYIIPRYWSGLMACEEIDLSHPVMRQVPA